MTRFAEFRGKWEKGGQLHNNDFRTDCFRRITSGCNLFIFPSVRCFLMQSRRAHISVFPFKSKFQVHFSKLFHSPTPPNYDIGWFFRMITMFQTTQFGILGQRRQNDSPYCSLPIDQFRCFIVTGHSIGRTPLADGCRATQVVSYNEMNTPLSVGRTTDKRSG